MIAEPYICLKGPTAGEIWWWNSDKECVYDNCIDYQRKGYWQPYADFEREKLKELGTGLIVIDSSGPYWMCVNTAANKYRSCDLINYYTSEFLRDSESSRLLKRMEFLREVCKREGVTWLPEVCDTCGTPL